LARLGLTAERHRREAEGDALDLTALIELVVDRAAGQAGDARGAAIRHGAHVLSSRAGTSMMLLVLISDGVPYENGYERRYAAQDTRRALRESVKRGIGCACVSVRAATEEDVLQQVWGDVPHRRLPDAAALERHVQPLFRDALRAAAATGGGQHVSRALTRDG
jgi:nitric oxide reductase activation protein